MTADKGPSLAGAGEVAEREKAFWDEHVPALQECVREYVRGPDANTARMLDVVEPLAGRRVLDIGCGAGVTSAFAARRGATVTGIDISAASIARARELADQAGLAIQFVAEDLTTGRFPAESFDAIIGRYILHHLDLRLIAPVIRELLVPGATAAFVETMGLNPVLRFSRRRLAGRAGIASYGSEDEHPIDAADLELLSRTIGEVRLEVGQMQFLRIVDRNVLRYRLRPVSRILAAADDALLRMGLGSWSYHQVVMIRKHE